MQASLYGSALIQAGKFTFTSPFQLKSSSQGFLTENVANSFSVNIVDRLEKSILFGERKPEIKRFDEMTADEQEAFLDRPMGSIHNRLFDSYTQSLLSGQGISTIRALIEQKRDWIPSATRSHGRNSDISIKRLEFIDDFMEEHGLYYKPSDGHFADMTEEEKPIFLGRKLRSFPIIKTWGSEETVASLEHANIHTVQDLIDVPSAGVLKMRVNTAATNDEQHQLFGEKMAPIWRFMEYYQIGFAANFIY